MIATPRSKKYTSELKGSPASVILVGIDGELRLSPEAMSFIENSVCSNDDPCLVIHWIEDGVMEAVFDVMGNQILNLPAPPDFLNMTSPE